VFVISGDEHSFFYKKPGPLRRVLMHIHKYTRGGYTSSA
jgi:hypothetical protein